MPVVVVPNLLETWVVIMSVVLPVELAVHWQVVSNQLAEMEVLGEEPLLEEVPLMVQPEVVL